MLSPTEKMLFIKRFERVYSLIKSLVNSYEIHVLAPFGSQTLYVHQAVRMQVTDLGSVKGEGKAYNQASLSGEVIIISTSCTYIIQPKIATLKKCRVLWLLYM